MIKSIVLGLILTQNLQVTFKPSTPITFEFDHSGDDGLGGKPAFRLWCDGIIVKNYSVSEADAGKSLVKNSDGRFTYTLSYAGFPTLGVRNCTISAYNAFDLDSNKSNTLPFVIGDNPSTPINFRFVINIIK